MNDILIVAIWSSIIMVISGTIMLSYRILWSIKEYRKHRKEERNMKRKIIDYLDRWMVDEKKEWEPGDRPDLEDVD